MMLFKDYLKAITDVANRGDAREESFYAALAGLLEEFATSTSRDDAHVATLPRPTEAGNPDFRVWNGRDTITGYVEAKWLKDRKERELNPDDIKTYCRIITALQHTTDLQEEIDALYPDVEAEIVEIER